MDGRCALKSGNSAAITPSLDGFSLPGWIYRDADFLEVEKERVFATSWQIVCHLSDIPHPGDYHTLDFLGEPLVAVGIVPRGSWTRARGIVPGASSAPIMLGATT
jgi:hypothetical protein